MRVRGHPASRGHVRLWRRGASLLCTSSLSASNETRHLSLQKPPVASISTSSAQRASTARARSCRTAASTSQQVCSTRRTFGAECGCVLCASDAQLRSYVGKIEVWLNNTFHELLIGFYDLAIELPLSTRAIAGSSLPITVTLNTRLVTVNTTVTGLGLLTSYLQLCPGQGVCLRAAGGLLAPDLPSQTCRS